VRGVVGEDETARLIISNTAFVLHLDVVGVDLLARQDIEGAVVAPAQEDAAATVMPGSVSHVGLPGRQLGFVRGRGGRGVRRGAVGGGARVGGRHGICPLSAGGDPLAVAALHPGLACTEVGQPDSQRRLTVLVVLFSPPLVFLAIRVGSRAVRFGRHPIQILPQTATSTLAGTELRHQAVALLLPHRGGLLLLRPVPRLPSALLLAV